MKAFFEAANPGHEIVKENTRQVDHFIFKTDAFGGRYLAIDMSGYTTDQSIKEFLSSLERNWEGESYDNFSFGGGLGKLPYSIKGRPVTLVTDSSLQNYPGELLFKDSDGTLYETRNSSRKDLEAIGADIEAIENNDLAMDLSNKYGLSDDRATKVAKIANSFSKLSKKRTLTERDYNILTKGIIGVDYKNAKNALEKHYQGDSVDYENLLDDAADMNGTSPEAVQEILADYLLK